MKEAEIKQLFAKTASHLRLLQGRLETVEDTSEKQASELKRYKRLEKARNLAKLAHRRGFCEGDPESIEKQAQSYMSEDLDIVEAGLKMATTGFNFDTADEESLPKTASANPIDELVSPYTR